MNRRQVFGLAALPALALIPASLFKKAVPCWQIPEGHIRFTDWWGPDFRIHRADVMFTTQDGWRHQWGVDYNDTPDAKQGAIQVLQRAVKREIERKGSQKVTWHNPHTFNIGD